MWQVTIASLRSQSRRLVAPGIAIVLGVAFVAASLSLGQTLGGSVRSMVAGYYTDYDAVVAAHKNLIAAKPTGRLLVVGGAGALRVGDQRLLDSPEFPAEYLPEATAFAQVHEDQAAAHQPQLVFVDDQNRQTALRHHVPVQTE